jgi:hypothetical protein
MQFDVINNELLGTIYGEDKRKKKRGEKEREEEEGGSGGEIFLILEPFPLHYYIA